MNLSMISGPVLEVHDGAFTIQHHTSAVYVTTKPGFYTPKVAEKVNVFGSTAGALNKDVVDFPIFSAREIEPIN